MPWKSSTFDAVCEGLRQSARRGHFVPHQWIERIDDGPFGSIAVRGCGWGLVGWYVGVMHKGLQWTREKLPAGDTFQEDVNEVLAMSGLTPEEIQRLTPEFVYQRFDQELCETYENRGRVGGWDAFITKSMLMAEFFIDVLRRIPVADETGETMSDPKLAALPPPETSLVTHKADVTRSAHTEPTAAAVA